MMKRLLLFGMVYLLLPFFAHGQFPSIVSPDQQISVQIISTQPLKYRVLFEGKVVIQPSALGFQWSKPKVELTHFVLKSSETQTIHAPWKPFLGEQSDIPNDYQELTLHLESTSSPQILVDLKFRVYNDGFAFRYHFPTQPTVKHFVVQDELSEFNLTTDPTTYWIPGDYETNEYLYQKTKLSEIRALEASAQEKDIALKEPIGDYFVQTPLLMYTSDPIFLQLHEAALVHYPVMHIEVDREKRSLKSHLVPDAVGNKAYLETPFSTPWRVMHISKTPEGILDSPLILNLNEPSSYTSTDWIKPQRFIGVWWEMHVGKGSWQYSGGQHAANTENVKRYLDFAAEYGLDGVLVEGWNEGWEDWFGHWKENVFDFVTPYPDYAIRELSNYAQQRGVKLIMHHETSGSVTNYERRMETAFQFMKQHGIETVKTGYVGRIIPRGERHDGQWMNDHYIRVAQKAAEHQLMVISHESSRPTGLHRTFPNWMASEAARGNEFNNAPTLGLTPEHETILPFTRLKGGPMDYTPGFFQFSLNQYIPERTTKVRTTIAKQLALFVVFFSPIQMIGDLPENMAKYPDLIRFIVNIPLTWAKSMTLKAFPGDMVVQARQSENGDWYVAGISDEQAREVTIDFSFLPPHTSFEASYLLDGPGASYDQNPTSISQAQKIITSKTKEKVTMAPGGGFVIRLKAISKNK